MSALDIQIGGSHYKDCVIQPVEYSTKNGLGFIEGSVVKYISRHNKETGKGRQDLEKIKHYIDLLIELQYPDSPKEPEHARAQKVLYNPSVECQHHVPITHICEQCIRDVKKELHRDFIYCPHDVHIGDHCSACPGGKAQ